MVIVDFFAELEMAKQKIIIGSSTARPCTFDGSELEMTVGFVFDPLVSIADAIRGLLGRLHAMGVVCLREPKARFSLSKDEFRSCIVIDVEESTELLPVVLARYCARINYSDQVGLFQRSDDYPKVTVGDDILALVDDEAVRSKFSLSLVQFNDQISISVDGERVGEFAEKIKRPPIDCPTPNPDLISRRGIYFGYHSKRRIVFFRDEQTRESMEFFYDPASFHVILMEVGARVNRRVDIRYREEVSGRRKIELILESINMVDVDQDEMF